MQLQADVWTKRVGSGEHCCACPFDSSQGEAGQPRLAQSFSSGDLKILGDPQVPFPT